MNLSDLSKIDIQDLQKIDYPRLWEDLRRRPDLLVVGASILLALILSFNVIAHSQREIRNIQTEKKLLEEKVKKINEYTAVKKELDDFINAVPPPITEREMVNLITDYANSHKIRIDSLLPIKGESTASYDSATVALSISINDYRTLWRFLHDLEQSPYALRIDSWTAAVSQGQRSNPARIISGNNPDAENWITARISLSGLNIKKP